MNNGIPNNFNNSGLNNQSNLQSGDMKNPISEQAKKDLLQGQSSIGNGPNLMQGMQNVNQNQNMMQGQSNVINIPGVIQGNPVQNTQTQNSQNQVQIPGQSNSGINAHTMSLEPQKIQQENNINHENDKLTDQAQILNDLQGINTIQNQPERYDNLNNGFINHNVIPNQTIKSPNLKSEEIILNQFSKPDTEQNQVNNLFNNASNQGQILSGLQGISAIANEFEKHDNLNNNFENKNMNSNETIKSPNFISEGTATNQFEKSGNEQNQTSNLYNNASAQNQILNGLQGMGTASNEFEKHDNLNNSFANENITTNQILSQNNNFGKTMNEYDNQVQPNSNISQPNNYIGGIHPTPTIQGMSQVGQTELSHQPMSSDIRLDEPQKKKFPLSVRETILVAIALIGVIIVILQYLFGISIF